MSMALAAIADNDDLLALDQVDVGIAIIINTHRRFLVSGRDRPINQALDQGDRRPPANFRRCLEHFPPQGKPFSRMALRRIMRREGPDTARPAAITPSRY